MNTQECKWKAFYRPFFSTDEDTKNFVDPLEELCSPEDPRHPAKIMMHQVQRLITLADDLPTIREGNDSLPLLFYLICAENIAKLADKFDRDGYSKQYTVNFFEWFLNSDQRKFISNGIKKTGENEWTLKKAIEVIYSVRCDTVHEGRYWGFHFSDGNTRMMNDDSVVVSITKNGLRDAIVYGAIVAINAYPKKPSNEATAIQKN